MEEDLKNLENSGKISTKPGKGKRWLKGILIGFLILVGFFGLLFGIFYVSMLRDMPGKCYDNLDYDPNHYCPNHESNWGFDDCNYKYHTKQFCYHKPIIYLYPTRETEVNVKLGIPENLLHTYPKYNSEKGRNVIAQPNGDLEDTDTGRKLYALYREGKSDNEINFDEGFVVAGKDIIPFLEEKLAILGLNEREVEEFIVYRLPQMENNEWNLIRFETIEEQNKNMPLNITPTPDTVIRVMMDWKAIEESVDIPQQQLITPERNGFTVVEWGGSVRN